MSRLRVGVVASLWHQPITDALLAGAREVLLDAGAEIEEVHVPGTWEIPVAAKALLDRGKVAAVVALGCVMQGDTSHAEHLVSQVGAALMTLQIESGKPVAWGVLAVQDEAQAWERAGGEVGHRGREAAAAAVETLHALEALA